MFIRVIRVPILLCLLRILHLKDFRQVLFNRKGLPALSAFGTGRRQAGRKERKGFCFLLPGSVFTSFPLRPLRSLRLKTLFS